MSSPEKPACDSEGKEDEEDLGGWLEWRSLSGCDDDAAEVHVGESCAAIPVTPSSDDRAQTAALAAESEDASSLLPVPLYASVRTGSLSAGAAGFSESPPGALRDRDVTSIDEPSPDAAPSAAAAAAASPLHWHEHQPVPVLDEAPPLLPPVAADAEPHPPEALAEALALAQALALHGAVCRACAGSEALHPRRIKERMIAEEVMRRVGMIGGVGAVFELSTSSEALESRESLAWFAEHERRLRADDWVRRPAATTAVAAGRLVADLIKRWVDVPVTESRRVAARSETTGTGTGSGGERDESDATGTGSADRDRDASAARPDARNVLRPQRSDSRATDVVFTFGDAAWLQRIGAQPEARAPPPQAVPARAHADSP